MTMYRSSLAGRVAVVTGASRGIGAGIAAALAACGARVMLTGRDVAALEAATREARATGGEAVWSAADVTREDQVGQLLDETRARLGEPTLLVANAGGGGEPRPLQAETQEHWREVVDANLTSAFLTLKAFLPPMMAGGRGSIVTMASTAGRQVSGASAPYAAAKAGLLSLTRQAAREAGPHGVRINAIAPSAIVTERLARQPQDRRRQIGESFPLKRIGEIDDVAAAALFLLSDQASWITGVTLDVAGGHVMV